MERFEDFEMAQGRKVQRQKIAPLIKGNSNEIRRITAQMLRKKMQHGARSANGCRPILEAKAVERSYFEMFAQRVHGGLGCEYPIIVAVGNPAIRAGSTRPESLRASGIVVRGRTLGALLAAKKSRHGRRLGRKNQLSGSHPLQLRHQ